LVGLNGRRLSPWSIPNIAAGCSRRSTIPVVSGCSLSSKLQLKTRRRAKEEAFAILPPAGAGRTGVRVSMRGWRGGGAHVGVRESVRQDAGSPFVAVRVASRRYYTRTDEWALLTPTSRSAARQKGSQNARGRAVTGPKKALSRGVFEPWRGQKTANEKGSKNGLEKDRCPQCCRAVSPVLTKPTRAGYGRHIQGSLPVANRECFAPPINARQQYRATTTRPGAAVIRWLLSTKRPQALRQAKLMAWCPHEAGGLSPNIERTIRCPTMS